MGIETAILAASIGATATSTIGAYQQSKAAQQQAKFSARVAERNALYASQDATRIGQEGQQEVSDLQRRIALAVGDGRATAASRGVLADDGLNDSASQHLSDIYSEGQYDIAKSRDATALRQRDALIRGDGFTTSAAGYRTQAKSYNPLLDAGSTLLSGGSKTADSKAARSLFG